MAGKHPEGFCLMQYRCKRCLVVEVVWNSRDGITPFIIPCKSCGYREMQHVNWKQDKHVPDYCPKPGDRVFINRTPALARLYTRMAVERLWDHPEYPLKDQFATKAEAVDRMAQVGENEPFLYTIANFT